MFLKKKKVTCVELCFDKMPLVAVLRIDSERGGSRRQFQGTRPGRSLERVAAAGGQVGGSVCTLGCSGRALLMGWRRGMDDSKVSGHLDVKRTGNS